MKRMVSEIIYDSLQVILRMFSRTTFQYVVFDNAEPGPKN